MGTVSWTRGAGPLVPHVAGFGDELIRLGHPPGTAKHHLRLMGQLNRWLAAEQLTLNDLTLSVAKEFLALRPDRGQRGRLTMASLSPLFDYLRGQQVLPPEPPLVPTRRDELLDRYRHHLVHDRGLTASTVRRYGRFAERFLDARASRTGAEIGVEGLVCGEVTAYLLEASGRLAVSSAKAGSGRPAGAAAVPVFGRDP